MSLFDRCYTVIRKLEGGTTNRKEDRGRLTKWGVTQLTYDLYLGSKSRSRQSVKLMSESECKEIYFKYWRLAECDVLLELPRTALVHYDLAINSGDKKALIKLQELKLEVNFNTLSDVEISSLYLKKRQKYYDDIIKTNPTQRIFRNGWSNRLKLLEANFEFITTED